MGKISLKNWIPKIEPTSQITHFGTTPPDAYSKGDSHFSHVRQCFTMGVMQYAPLQTARRVEIDPLMYTKSNRKSASAKSLAWFPPYFCFRFSIKGHPNTTFRCFSTFWRRTARVVPPAMPRVPFLGKRRVGVTPNDSDHAECCSLSDNNVTINRGRINTIVKSVVKIDLSSMTELS